MHTCHWPNCNTAVPPAMWGCRSHWFALPKVLRNRVWAAYKSGQEITKTPSEEYIQVAHDVQDWIFQNYDLETGKKRAKPLDKNECHQGPVG